MTTEIQTELAGNIAEILHQHRHVKSGGAQHGRKPPVQLCSCGESLPDQGPMNMSGSMRVHRFDVHRSEIVAAWLMSGDDSGGN